MSYASRRHAAPPSRSWVRGGLADGGTSSFSSSRMHHRPEAAAAGEEGAELARRLEELERGYEEERNARLALEKQVEAQAQQLTDHADGLHVLMDMMEGAPQAGQLESMMAELQRSVQEAQEAQVQDLLVLRGEMGESGGQPLAEAVRALERSVQEVRGAPSDLRSLQDVEGRMQSLSAAIEARAAEASTQMAARESEATQRLQIIDAKHEALEHTIGVRFDSRLLIVEEVVNSVEARVNAELAEFEQRLGSEVERVDGIRSATSKQVAESTASLQKMLDRAMSEVQDGQNQLALRVDDKFAHFTHKFTLGGALDELRTRTEHCAAELKQLTEKHEAGLEASGRRAALASEAQADATLKHAALEAKLDSAAANLERYREAVDDRLRKEGQRMVALEKDTSASKSALLKSMVELRKDLEGGYARQVEIERIDAGAETAERAARASMQRLEDLVRERLEMCESSAQASARDVATRLSSEITSMEARLKQQDEASRQLERKAAEQIARVGPMMEAETRKAKEALGVRVKAEVETASIVLGSSIAQITGRVDSLELLQRGVDEMRQRVEGQCRALEQSLGARMQEAEHNYQARVGVVLGEIATAQDHTAGGLKALEGRVEKSVQSLQGQLSDSEARSIEALGAASRRLEKEAAQAQERLARELEKEAASLRAEVEDGRSMQELARGRQDEKISRVQEELLRGVATDVEVLRTEVGGKLAEQSRRVETQLHDVSADAEQATRRCESRMSELEDRLTETLDTGLAKVRGDMAAASATLEGRLTSHQRAAEEKLDGKADKSFVKMVEMMIRQDLDLVTEAIQQNAAGQQELEQGFAAVEEQVERLGGEGAELGCDLALLESTLSTIEAGVAEVGDGVSRVEEHAQREREAIRTQAREELAAARQALEGGVEALRVSLGEKVAGELERRLGTLEREVGSKLAPLAAQLEQAATKAELRTHVGLLEMKTDDVARAVQSVDEAVHEIGEAEGLAGRVEQLVETVQDLSVELALVSATGAIAIAVPGWEDEM
jgi:chromosome segregation ATPase